MKTFKTLSLFLLLLFIYCCGQGKDKEPAQIRWGQFLISDRSVHVSLSRKGTELYSTALDYAKLSEYQKYPSGKYTVSVKNGDLEILNKKIGLGTGGTYTLSIYGIPVQDQKANQRSTNAQLHRITEGAAAVSPNAFLPQLDVMDDYFASAKDESKIRIVHLAPGVEPIEAEILKAGKKRLSFSGIKYPKIAKNKSLSSGHASLSLILEGSSKEVNTTRFEVGKEKLYTFFVIPDRDQYLNHLRMVKGVTRKTTH